MGVTISRQGCHNHLNQCKTRIDSNKRRKLLPMLLILSIFILSLTLASYNQHQNSLIHSQQSDPSISQQVIDIDTHALIDNIQPTTTEETQTKAPPPRPKPITITMTTPSPSSSPSPSSQQPKQSITYAQYFISLIPKIPTISIRRRADNPQDQIGQGKVDDDTDQIEKFTSHQVFVQRVLATSSSCASIASCLVAFYFLFAIDPKRLVFRHHLIFFLLFFDLVKAIILLLYPTRVLTHNMSYYNERFCQAVGFFTATAIEGADVAIMAFAIHTYLVIFKPSLNTKVRNTNRVEGGLYRYRIYVYTLSIFLPLILASFAFVNGTGYASLVVWCYLPLRPLWYRMVLSWVPRYCIVIAILVIYGLIYYHVIREFKTLGGVFSTLHTGSDLANAKPSLYNSLKFFIRTIKDYLFPSFVIPESQTSDGKTEHKQERNTPGNRQLKHGNDDFEDEDELEDDMSSDVIEALPNPEDNNEHPNTERDASTSSATAFSSTDNANSNSEDKHENGNHNTGNSRESNAQFENPSLQQANLENFRKRQRVIQKQMKSIFVYPFAYCFVWLFPFILHATQINHEERYGPIYWINLLGAFMQPLNGFVDSLVFFYRERPWRYTVMKDFEREDKQRIDHIIISVHNPRNGSAHSGTQRGSAGDNEDENGEDGSESVRAMSTSARIAKNSFSATSGLVDMKSYRIWRIYLDKCKLPLYRLPTDENIKKFQTKYIDDKLEEMRQKELQRQARIYVYQQLARQHPQPPVLQLAQKHNVPIPANFNEKYLIEESSPDSSAGAFYDGAFPTNAHDFSCLLNDDSGFDFLNTSNIGTFSFSNQTGVKSNKPLSKTKSKSIDMTDPLTTKPAISKVKSNGTGNFGKGSFSQGISNGVGASKKGSAVSNSSQGQIQKYSPFGVTMGQGDGDEEEEEGELEFLEFLKKGPPA